MIAGTAAVAEGVLAYYEANATSFVSRYEGVSFEAVHGTLLPFLPSAGSAILDVGAGSGRDALALAERGYKVTAVEPTWSLRGRAEVRDLAGRVRWIDDRLPGLSSILAGQERFAFILCACVLMHVPPQNLAASFEAMALLLQPHGHLAACVRDPAPGEPHFFHCHAPPTVIAEAASADLALVSHRRSDDVLGRPDRLWHTYVFRK